MDQSNGGPNDSSSNNDEKSEQDSAASMANALREACTKRDASLVDLLIRHGARDPDGAALEVAAQNNDFHLMSKILALKSHPDPEFKINKKAIEFGMSSSGGGAGSGIAAFLGLGSVTFSSLFPTTPVMINWHSMKGLSELRQQWLIDAAVAHNIKLKLNLQNQMTALIAITRIDLSNNDLVSLPLCLFQLQSLRVLNISQNKLERLPETEEPCSPSSKSPSSSSKSFFKMKKSRSYSSSLSSQRSGRGFVGWNLPCLQELQLQDNRLEFVPVSVFELPSLQFLDLSNNKISTMPYKMWTAPKLKELNLCMNLLRDLPFASNVSNIPNPTTPTRSKSPTHLASEVIKENPTLPIDDQEESDQQTEMSSAKDLKTLEMKRINLWSQSVDIVVSPLFDEEVEKLQSCKLSSLNLGHNSFSRVPVVLPCFAVNLTRLNMSYNCLTDMGSVKHYPASIKHLDFSYNQITSWMTSECDDSSFICYACPGAPSASAILSGDDNSSPRKKAVINANTNRPLILSCPHKQHSRLDNLRTLILSKNQLTTLWLSTDKDSRGCDQFDGTDDFESLSPTMDAKNLRSQKWLFPNLSTLDVSFNNIAEVPISIADLGNLSVLNLNGNTKICRLPPEMGLLNKLWNLGVRGCNLNDPLKSMIESKKYKTMDIIGYLKSVLEDARPYARMKLMIVGVQGIGKTTLLDLLRGEGSGSRKRPPEHWAKRMGHKNINLKTPKGVTLSTVGVDVNEWVYEKKLRGEPSFGPVYFRTWDFGGQREYYATHQYFLSKRSLYLVVWKVTEGEKGIDSILQWLVNIQARAPNAPVIIVGTHYDLIREFFPPFFAEDLQEIIRNRFINVIDPDKCGLPRVVDSIFISAKTKFNIKQLCYLIYDTVFDLRCPGSKERLLEQKIPATYIALEEVIGMIAIERRMEDRDPVLRSERYRTDVTEKMKQRFGLQFRDASELHQATAFLHENGVLLHYEDATLKDLYFLDPQWLCDVLAHVVTIKEINPYAKNGIMKTDDLKHLFKSSICSLNDARTYILNLLNKFEVALTWDTRTLLIPSLLPTEEHLLAGITGCDVRIPVRSRGWALKSLGAKFQAPEVEIVLEGSLAKLSVTTSSAAKSRVGSVSSTTTLDEVGNSTFYAGREVALSSQVVSEKDSSEQEFRPRVKLNFICRPQLSVHRLLLMTYFPSGFWSRLITRILADDQVIEIIRGYFKIPREAQSDPMILSIFNKKAEWRLWQTGVALVYFDHIIFRVKEALQFVPSIPYEFHRMKFMVQQEGVWTDVQISKSSILEIYLPNQSFSAKVQTSEREYEIRMEPNEENIARLLALTVDHVDTLLEDWYPLLGTRFVHTSQGKFLVTRIVPCTKCLTSVLIDDQSAFDRFSGEGSNSDGSSKPKTSSTNNANSSSRNGRKITHSQDSYLKDNDSGVGFGESLGSSKASSLDGVELSMATDFNALILAQRQYESEVDPTIYSWIVEECILAAHEQKGVECPVHSSLPLELIAPDTVFADLGEHHLIKPENIRKGKMLGRGAFGFVFRASCKQRGSSMWSDVAMKMLEPADPGYGARQSDIAAYKAATQKWERDGLQYACKAYCTARQELNILLTLKHPHIVPLVGVSRKPLALVLRLAPMGSLDGLLREYRRSGAQLNFKCLHQVIMQIAKALEYLHQHHIIYRDLKSENVLAFEFPAPFSYRGDDGRKLRVDVKLADYGISRSFLPTGTKGFGGTEGFMAPEIIKYNGEEEYTEKVDCFSYGMFIYELLTLRLPFEGIECVKDYILDGGRPSLTPRDLTFPSYVLDLMTLCWSHQPKYRPAASQIVSIASAPEFIHLLDVMALDEQSALLSGLGLDKISSGNHPTNQVWVTRLSRQSEILFCDNNAWIEYKAIESASGITATCLCLVDDTVWVGDSKATIHVFSCGPHYKELRQFRLDPEEVTPTAIKCMSHLESIHLVAISSTSGRLWVSSTGEDVDLREIGDSDAPFLCVTSIVPQPGSYELWCGRNGGVVSIISLQENAITGHEIVSHYEDDKTLPTADRGDVFQVTARSSWVWTYMYPGCVVYQWNASQRRIVHKLDCSKLVPCSESLLSINLEDHLDPVKCQVSAMAVLEEQLFIGTTWGSLVVVEGSSMRPITVFRPYEEDVKAIIAFTVKHSSHSEAVSNESDTFSPNNASWRQTLGLSTESSSSISSTSSTCSLADRRTRLQFITIGKGYRHLLSRYLQIKQTRSFASKDLYAILWESGQWMD